MIQDRRISIWIGYLSSVAIELVLTRLLIAVHQFVPLGQYPIYYVLVIMLVAYVFGEGPAILAFFLGLLAFDYFFVPPLYTVLPHPETPAAWASLIAYLMGTSIVGFATVMIRRSGRRMSQALAIAEQEVTERKKAEEALETARKAAEYGKSRLEAVLEALPVGMSITDAKGGVIMVNKAFEQVWSGPRPPTKSVRDYAGYKAWWVDTGKPVAPEEWAAAQAVQKGETVIGQLVEIQRFDGSRAFAINSASPIRDAEGNVVGSAVAIQDITALREAEEAQARSAYARELIEVSLDPLVTIGPDGKITDVNKATEEVTGVTRDKLIGSDFSIYFTEPKKARAGYQQVFSNGFVRDYPLAIRHSSGRVTEVFYNASVYRDQAGNVIGVFAAARDITERKKIEEMERDREIEEHKLEFYQRTILAATDGKLVIAEVSEIERIAGPAEASWEIRTPEDIALIRHGLEAFAQCAEMDECRLGQLAVAVGEAATNTFKHAKEGQASIHNTKDGLLVVVSDRGQGIPALALPDVALTRGYSTTGTLGMGYKLMISFADKIYLATGAEGTTVGIQVRF